MPVMIAGAFRNGTTLTAKVLYDIAGYYGGHPKQLQRVNLEHRPVRKLSNDFLEAHGGHWIDPKRVASFTENNPASKEWSVSNLEQEWVRRVKYIARKFTEDAPDERWFWKDTRLPITLPAWNLLVPQCKIIVPYRRPDHAVSSMLKLVGRVRGFELASTEELALQVWQCYYGYLLDWLGLNPDINVIGIDYSEWFFGFDNLHNKLEEFLEESIDYDGMREIFKPKKNVLDFDSIPDNEIYARLQTYFSK